MSSPNDDIVLYLSHLLDEHLFSGIYQQGANQLEFSLSSSLAHMTRVTTKLKPIKVYSFAFGVLCCLACVRVSGYNQIKGMIYLVLAHDSVRVSYNCYEKTYASIAARRTLTSARELGATIMSFFRCGEKARDADQQNELQDLAENVRWRFLMDGTFLEKAYNKAKEMKIVS